MKIGIESRCDNTIFRISDFDGKYRPVLDMCFYQKDGDTYFKIFPSDHPGLRIIGEYFVKYGQAMFDQLGYFAPIPWEEALEAFLQRVDGQNIDWWLTGSCAACVRGVALDPHDVDIMIDSREVPRIRELFSDCIIEPIRNTEGWVTKDFGVLFLHARIDIASDPVAVLDDPDPVDCGPYARTHLEEITWRGYTLRIPPLALQINVNKRRGRLDRVRKMEEFRDIINSE